MNPFQLKKLQALLAKHLPLDKLATQESFSEKNTDAPLEAALSLIEHLALENKKLEKDYRTLAIAASESFYSMANQIARHQPETSSYEG